MTLFLDPEKPIATCETETCDGCPAGHHLHCHFRLKDWIHFFLIAVPPFLIGGAGISNYSGWLLIPWLVYAIAFFGFIEIRVMCSHCPHYAESALSSLKCWANYGSPKKWKYRPGPMNILEKFVFIGSFVIIWGYPLVLTLLAKQLFLLIIYCMTTGGFFMTLKSLMCSRCINFACPLNGVDEQTRALFFEKSPSVGEAWKE